jgi:hypothetical protein
MTDSPPTKPLNRSLGAERMRLHRQRRQDGLRYLGIEIRQSELDWFISRGFLKPEMRDDLNTIIEAIYAFFDHTISQQS